MEGYPQGVEGGAKDGVEVCFDRVCGGGVDRRAVAGLVAMRKSL